MHIVLWDTRTLNVSKDFAGGMGIGLYPGYGGWRGRLIRHFYKRDRRPVALLFAHLAAIFRRLGHTVQYTEDHLVHGADLYVFCPSLVTLHLERDAMARLRAENPSAHILVVGLVPTVIPEAFDGLGVTVVKGEAEQLLWKLDEVLERPKVTIQLGTIEDLDTLPLPDWSPFGPERFRAAFDFWQFPTAYIQSSRGCTFGCNYCPYTVLDNSTRFRDPLSVVEEVRNGIRRWGFGSFKFRDPLFGLNRQAMFRLAEQLGHLSQKIQFSVESRIELLQPEVLRVLKRVGLTSVTVGIETPDADTLRRFHRVPIREDRQRDFIALCRSMGIRTVAQFLIGFPDDTEASIAHLLSYAQSLGPTIANFNVVTPYPGTEFFEQMKDQIADFDFSHYDIFTPLLKYTHLIPTQLGSLHEWCTRRYYFRWKYLAQNAHLLWPSLQKFGLGRERVAKVSGDAAHSVPPKPIGADSLRRKGIRRDNAH